MKDLAPLVGEREACVRVGYPRASFQRHHVLVAAEPTVTAMTEAQPRHRRSRQQERYEARQAKRDHDREAKRVIARVRRPLH